MSPQAPRTLRHRRTKRAPERSGLNSAQRGYNWEWRRFRKAWLAEQFASGKVTCAMCGKLLDGKSKNVHVDHIQDHKGNYETFWDESNLQILHASCHSKKTVKQNGFGRSG